MENRELLLVIETQGLFRRNVSQPGEPGGCTRTPMPRRVLLKHTPGPARVLLGPPGFVIKTAGLQALAPSRCCFKKPGLQRRPLGLGNAQRYQRNDARKSCTRKFGCI